MRDISLFKPQPIAGAKLKELSEKKPRIIMDAMSIASTDAKKSLAGNNSMTYIYEDDSKLTMYLNGICIVHTGWIKQDDVAYFLDDESLDIMTLRL